MAKPKSMEEMIRIGRQNSLASKQIEDRLKDAGYIHKSGYDELKERFDAVTKALKYSCCENEQLRSELQPILDALEHIAESFWSEGESYQERFEYLQDYAKQTLKQTSERINNNG